MTTPLPAFPFLGTSPLSPDTQRIKKSLTERRTLLRESFDGLDGLPFQAPRDRLAVTDLFVEKAQLVLARRAIWLFISGSLCSIAVLALLAATVGIVLWKAASVPNDPTTNTVVLSVFQSLGLAGFALVAAKWLISLARSFFHEALALWERRHALRFGRLWVYLNGANKVTFEELAEAFQWNKETSTSFLDVRPDLIARTLLHDAVDAVGKAPGEVAKAIKRNGKPVP